MNTQTLVPTDHLSDEPLLARVKGLAADERRVTVALIAHLAELDRRRLYLAEGYSSLFTYCTEELHLSEHAAYGRIEAARAGRRFPIILERLEEGSLTLTAVCLLAGLLTEENHREVLAAAHYKSKRQVEELVARLRPLPPVPSIVRRLPMPSPDAPASRTEPEAGAADLFLTGTIAPVAHASSRPAVIAPLAPERYKVQFTASAEMHEKFRQAQALLRHQIPDGDPAAVFDRALTALLENLTKQKHAATEKPRSRHATPAVHEERAEMPQLSPSRYIPAEVRREVWQRDGGRCAFVGANGRRCPEQGFLEYHHGVPYSAGGPATVGNIQLRCRAHNGYEADVTLGRRESTLRVRRSVQSEEELGPDRAPAQGGGHRREAHLRSRAPV